MSTATPEPILLTGIASLDTVAGIRERAIVLASDAGDGELVFDLSGLEVDGSAVVSLLLSIVRDLRDHDVRFENATASLLQIAEAYGVAEILAISGRKVRD